MNKLHLFLLIVISPALFSQKLVIEYNDIDSITYHKPSFNGGPIVLE